MSPVHGNPVVVHPTNPDIWGDVPFPNLDGMDRSLSGWPGAVIEFSANGALIGANDVGARFAREAINTPGSPILGLVALAHEAQGSVCDKIEVLIEGTSRWFECIALPATGNRIYVLARDNTYDVNIRQALFDSRQRYRDLVTISSDFAWETDVEGRFVFVSPHGALGYSPEDLLGRHPDEFLVESDVANVDLPFQAREPIVHAQVWLRNSENEEACLLASAVPVVGPHGVWRGARGVCRDVTHERLRDSELAQSKVREQVVAYIVNQIREEARPQAMLEAAATMLGRATSSEAAVMSYAPEEGWKILATHGNWPETIGEAELAMHLEEGSDTFEVRIDEHRVFGRRTWYHGAVNGSVLLMRNIMGRRWHEDEHAILSAVAGQLAIAMRQIADQLDLERMSKSDGLTGLMNRRAFQDALEASMARAVRDGSTGALLYIDLDNFKAINDNRGHEVGDTVLCEISEMLTSCSRIYDLVARIGGDEFAIWLNDLDIGNATKRADEFLTTLSQLAERSGEITKPLGASIGIAQFEPASGETLRDLLIRADHAMYAAKKSGKNGWAVAGYRADLAASDGAEESVGDLVSPVVIQSSRGGSDR
ncbi:MAG: sensor domain-containing diguanylate cyclase [Proteobacteria bacterium]|nr:sensor domain-containing diguanylate cyclase [Pseudomonadota bacterium]